MANYRARLDRIEAVLNPQVMDAPFFVWIDEGMTLEEAATQYALDNGLATSLVLQRGIFACWSRPSESADGGNENGRRPPCLETV